MAPLRTKTKRQISNSNGRPLLTTLNTNFLKVLIFMKILNFITGQSRLVEAFVRKISVAADVEKKHNEKEKQKRNGQEVRRSNTIAPC